MQEYLHDKPRTKRQPMKEEAVKDLDKPASTDPGGARLGNFINYYQFNPPIQR